MTPRPPGAAPGAAGGPIEDLASPPPTGSCLIPLAAPAAPLRQEESTLVSLPSTSDLIPAQPSCCEVHARAATGPTPNGHDGHDGHDGAVRVMEVVRDARTGVRHRRLHVDDGHDGAERAAVQAEFAAQDAVLRENPAWAPPELDGADLVLHHEVSRWFYRSATLREWRRELVPSASALHPMQRPDAPHLPSGGLIDPVARRVFKHCLDAIGIRTRALLMREVVQEHAFAGAGDGAGRPGSWVSLACGAAVPVLDAVRVLERAGGVRPHLHLVDVAPQALAFARRLAAQQGLVEGADFTLLERDLVTGVVARDLLLAELGEASAAVVDAVGIFEYFRDAACVRLLRNAYRLLRPGGVLVVANMLTGRRELDLNQRGAGWPRLFPRSAEQLVELVRRADLPLERTTVSVAGDGVYAVVDVRR